MESNVALDPGIFETIANATNECIDFLSRMRIYNYTNCLEKNLNWVSGNEYSAVVDFWFRKSLKGEKKFSLHSSPFITITFITIFQL